MFDWLKCEAPLPDGYEGTFQTKDFDCTLTDVVIRKDGTLHILRFDQEVVPKAERPFPDGEGIAGIVGSMRRVNERWEHLTFHGIVNFYDIGHDYDAKFTDGQLVSIVKLEDA